MRYLFLSPHYDDAIYSCGGTIAGLSQAGHNVEILTVMAGIPVLPLPDTPVLQDNHQRWQSGKNPVLARRKEDQEASRIVDAKPVYFDLPDCIYRVANGMPLYATEESLWSMIHPDDPAPEILQTLQLDEFDLIFAPLGVGRHVDHLIVRNYALQLAQNGTFPVQFYREYPYLRDSQTVDDARKAFPVALETLVRPVSEISMQDKIKAMSTYQSQVSSFWDNESSIEAEVRKTFSDEDQFVELFEQIKSP